MITRIDIVERDSCMAMIHDGADLHVVLGGGNAAERFIRTMDFSLSPQRIADAILVALTARRDGETRDDPLGVLVIRGKDIGCASVLINF